MRKSDFVFVLILFRSVMYSLILIAFVSLFTDTNCQSLFRRPEYYPQNGSCANCCCSLFVRIINFILTILLVVNSILTPFIIKNECHTSADNRVGICMPKATCLTTGGIITGNCGLLSSCCICKSISLKS